jgi:hypothetical protein
MLIHTDSTSYPCIHAEVLRLLTRVGLLQRVCVGLESRFETLKSALHNSKRQKADGHRLGLDRTAVMKMTPHDENKVCSCLLVSFALSDDTLTGKSHASKSGP